MNKEVAKRIVSTSFSLLFLCIVLVLFYYVFETSYNYSYHIFANEAYEPTAKYKTKITIKKGDSTKAIAQNLAAKGLVDDADSMMIRIYCSKYNGQIKPGTYEVSPAMKMDEILAVLSQDNKEEEKR